MHAAYLCTVCSTVQSQSADPDGSSSTSSWYGTEPRDRNAVSSLKHKALEKGSHVFISGSGTYVEFRCVAPAFASVACTRSRLR